MMTWGSATAPSGDEGDRGSEGRPERSALRTAGRILTALLVGGIMGLVAMVGLLAFRAAVEEVYLHSWNDLYGSYLLVALIPPLVLAALAWTDNRRRFWRWLGRLGVGALGGAVVGAALGRWLVSHPSGPWAGALMGAGGLVFGLTLAALVQILRRPTLRVASRGASDVAGRVGSALSPAIVLTLSALLSGCGPEPDPAPGDPEVGEPSDTSRVESVVFLLGDPGVARADRFPVVPRMRRDVEAWSSVLEGRGDVRMLVLGDIVYPEGVHAPGDPRRETDSLHVASQISILGGPGAETAGARGLFIPGNHDWGQEEDHAGAVRLQRLDSFLESWSGAAQGRVELTPPTGEGVEVRDVGAHLRLVLLDTAWWLLGREDGEREVFLDQVRQALRTRGTRRVVMAAHHPLETGGPHGAGVDLGSFLGIRLLLKRAGIMVQDLDSRPYASLKSALLEVFREEGPPALFVAGHDHSMQVFAGRPEGVPPSVVVGSASKLTGVSGAPHMRFGRSEPGYGKILVHDDGTLRLELSAAPERYLSCAPQELPECMEEGVDAYRTVWRETVGPGRVSSSRPVSPGA